MCRHNLRRASPSEFRGPVPVRGRAYRAGARPRRLPRPPFVAAMKAFAYDVRNAGRCGGLPTPRPASGARFRSSGLCGRPPRPAATGARVFLVIRRSLRRKGRVALPRRALRPSCRIEGVYLRDANVYVESSAHRRPRALAFGNGTSATVKPKPQARRNAANVAPFTPPLP